MLCAVSCYVDKVNRTITGFRFFATENFVFKINYNVTCQLMFVDVTSKEN
jgi:hypothetical protein